MTMNDWLEAAQKLSLEAKRLEKKYAPSVNDEGYREYHANVVAREQTNRKKHKQITHFQGSLSNISATLRNMENDKLDCVYFQNLLEGFESKLSTFKASMAKEYEVLVESEQHLFNDLSVLGECIECTMIETENSKAQTSTSAVLAKKQLEEVKNRNDKISAHKAEIGAIERKLTSLGDRYGGWDPRDHDIFIRVWTQHVGAITGGLKKQQSVGSGVDDESNQNDSPLLDLGSKVAYILRRKLVQAVQMKTEEEIEEHLLWFVEVESLQTRKKQILSAWKREKEREKPDSMTESTICSPNRQISVASTTVSDRKRELNKMKLEKWHKEKEEEKKQKELNEVRKKEELKRLREREMSERQQSNRVLVQNWVEERKSKEESASNAKKVQSTKVTAAELEILRRKQEQEIDKAKALRKKVSTARAASTGRLQRQKELAETVTDPAMKARVKSKLHEPTKVYLANCLTAEDLDMRERKRSSGGAHDSRVASGGYDLKFSGRAIPAWTRGVM